MGKADLENVPLTTEVAAKVEGKVLTCSMTGPERRWSQAPLPGNWPGPGGLPVGGEKNQSLQMMATSLHRAQITDVVDDGRWWKSGVHGGRRRASFMHIPLFRTRRQFICYLAARAILALSDRVPQNSIEGASPLETGNLLRLGSLDALTTQRSIQQPNTQISQCSFLSLHLSLLPSPDLHRPGS